MSALGQKICGAKGNVRFTPNSGTNAGAVGLSAKCQKRTLARLFNHHLGDGKHARRNGEAERLGVRRGNRRDRPRAVCAWPQAR